MNKIRLSAQRVAPHLLLVTAYEGKKEIGFAYIPEAIWNDRDELKILIQSMQKMRAEGIQMAFVEGKGVPHE